MSYADKIFAGPLRFTFVLFHSVLNKVSKYRGMNRDKNELNAAFWFTQPGMWSHSIKRSLLFSDFVGFLKFILNIYQGILCPFLGAEFRPHSQSKIATLFPNSMSDFPN